MRHGGRLIGRRFVRADRLRDGVFKAISSHCVLTALGGRRTLDLTQAGVRFIPLQWDASTENHPTGFDCLVVRLKQSYERTVGSGQIVSSVLRAV
jgi:hypothetical protein